MYYLLLFLILAYIIKYSITSYNRKKKSDIFFNKYFSEDRLYTLEEVSNAFKLDREHFLTLINTLEKHNYFIFFNKRGVSLVKDFYSQYELKYLVKILSKKNKL